MRRFLLCLLFVPVAVFSFSQNPTPVNRCSSNSIYRQFDFWIGTWEVYGLNGKKSGDSRIERILDSCIILENWTSANGGYAGKSFNTYNASTGQWQQTWVDNRGGSTEFLRGNAELGKMIFYAESVKGPNSTTFMRRLTFYKLDDNKVRQHGERSEDNGSSWKTEYDLEYRRK